MIRWIRPLFLLAILIVVLAAAMWLRRGSTIAPGESVSLRLDLLGETSRLDESIRLAGRIQDDSRSVRPEEYCLPVRLQNGAVHSSLEFQPGRLVVLRPEHELCRFEPDSLSIQFGKVLRKKDALVVLSVQVESLVQEGPAEEATVEGPSVQGTQEKPNLDQAAPTPEVTEAEESKDLGEESSSKIQQDRLEAERLEQARLEAKKREAERQELARLETERQEQARLEAERQELARLETERQEQARLEAERQEQARLEAERQEQARLEAERQQQARLEAERQELARLEAERQQQARLEAERQELARLETERLEEERLEAERAALDPDRTKPAEPPSDLSHEEPAPTGHPSKNRSYLEQAEELFQRGDFDAVLGFDIPQPEVGSPSYMEDRQIQDRMLEYRACALMSKGDMENATKAFEEIVASNPRAGVAQFNLLVCLYRQDRYNDVINFAYPDLQRRKSTIPTSRLKDILSKAAFYHAMSFVALCRADNVEPRSPNCRRAHRELRDFQIKWSTQARDLGIQKFVEAARYHLTDLESQGLRD